MEENKKIMKPEVGTEVYIQSYKHDGSLHRTWCKGFIIESDEEKVVAVTNKAWVIEADGRKWFTREPAICFFWYHRWYNVISMIRKTGIYYYCNIASPSLWDGEAIKNIDYDLDVKLYPDLSYQILDENEFKAHARKMNYPEEVVTIAQREVNKLIERMDCGEVPFTNQCINEYYRKYQNLLEQI